MAALSALELEKAKLQDAALQIVLELPLDEARQATVLLEALGEDRPMLGDGLVEERVFGAAACVAVGTHWGAPVRMRFRGSRSGVRHASRPSARTVPGSGR